MVTTRSGKTISFREKDVVRSLGGRKALKPSKLQIDCKRLPAAFVILEDKLSTSDDAAPPQPLLGTEKPVRLKEKALALPAASLEDNQENVNSINRVASCGMAKTVKVIGISEKEKAMNGAPEGALYEVSVTERDEELPAFPAESDALAALRAALLAYTSSQVWAEKFETVVTIRRCQHYFPRIFQDSSLLYASVEAILDSLTALRSTSAKNALLGLRTLLRQSAMQEESLVDRVASSLGNRLASAGPRFLQDFALTVAEEAAKRLAMAPFVTAMAKFLGHRNGEVVRKVASLIVSSITEEINKDASERSLKAIMSSGFRALADCLAALVHPSTLQSACLAMRKLRDLFEEDKDAAFVRLCQEEVADESKRKTVLRLMGQSS